MFTVFSCRPRPNLFENCLEHPHLLEPLFHVLSKYDALTGPEKERLSNIIQFDREVFAEQDIVIAGSEPDRSSLLLSGFAARYKLLANGSRQITSLHVAGDFIDLHAFLLKTMDHGIMAISDCRIAYAHHSDLEAVVAEEPHLTRLLWLNTLIDGAINREWIVAMGRRSKKSHLAHLICELYIRLNTVKLTHGMSFNLPLSQATLSDVLGLSTVHMNRVIQALRQEGVIRWTSQQIEILDWERLAEIAEFDMTYLRLELTDT